MNRRTGLAVGAAVLAVLVVVGGVGVARSGDSEPPAAAQPAVRSSPVPAAAPAQVGRAAPGWQWESYKTVQVQVPVGWTQYVAGPAPCGTSKEAGVGRFYDWMPRDHYVCADAVFAIESRHPYVWFDDVQAPGIKQYDGGWSEETRVVGGIKVTVLAPNATMRRRIIDSARPIGATDAYGCTPVDTGVGTEMRTELADGAEICKYFRGSLISSSRVPGRLAAHLGKMLLRDLTKPSVSTYKGCEQTDPPTYVVRLHSGARAWTMRLVNNVCPRPDSIDILMTGPHRPFDPGQLSMQPFEVVPTKR